MIVEDVLNRAFILRHEILSEIRKKFFENLQQWLHQPTMHNNRTSKCMTYVCTMFYIYHN